MLPHQRAVHQCGIFRPRTLRWKSGSSAPLDVQNQKFWFPNAGVPVFEYPDIHNTGNHQTHIVPVHLSENVPVPSQELHQFLFHAYNLQNT